MEYYGMAFFYLAVARWTLVAQKEGTLEWVRNEDFSSQKTRLAQTNTLQIAGRMHLYISPRIAI